MSEVLSYALVFGMILVAVSIVSVSGISTLDDVKSAEQVKNADRAYDVLADNMQDVYAEGAPSRATEINLGDSQLYIDEPTTFNVTLGSGAGKTAYVYDVRPIVYRLESDRALVYENGAVFQTHPESGVVRRNPPQFFGPDRGHVPVIRTMSDNVTSVGSATVLVRGESASRSILHSNDGVPSLHVNVTSPRADLWQRYYEEEVERTVGDCERPTDDRVICEIDPPNQVEVVLQDIRVSLIR